MDFRQYLSRDLLDEGDMVRQNTSLAMQLGNAQNENERQFLLNLAEETGQIAPRKDGMLKEFGQGVAYGGMGVMHGLLSTAEELGFGSGMRQWADDVMSRNQQLAPYEGYSGFSLNPTDIARTVGTGAAQSLGSMAVGAGATIATGNPAVGTAAMTAFMFGQIYGDRVKEYRDVMKGVPDGQVKALALLSSVGESLIESYIGPEQAVVRLFGKSAGEKAVGAAVRSLVKKVGKDEALNILGGGQATSELAKIVGKDVSDQVLGNAVKKLGQSGLKRLASEAVKDIAHDGAKKSMAALLANAVKTVGKEAAIGYLTEGSEEVSQMYWNELVKAMGTHHIELPAWEEVAEEFSGGAWTGLFMGGGQQMLSSFMDRAADRRYAAGETRQLAEGESIPQDAIPVNTEDEAEPDAENAERVPASDARGRMAEKIATMSGMDVVWLTPEQIEAEKSRRSEKLAAEGKEASDVSVGGWYHFDKERGKGTAYINPNDSRGIDFVIGHELYHDMMEGGQTGDKTVGQAVRRVIREAVRGKSEDGLNPAAQKLQEKIRSLYKEYKEGSEDFNQEFEADVWGHLFSDSEFMTDLGAELESRQKGLGAKFIEAIRDFVDRIIEAITGDESPESSRLLNDYEKTREALAKLAADYTENNAKAVNSALQSLHDTLYKSGPMQRDEEAARREAAREAGRAKAKDIAVEREQRTQDELRKDAEESAKFMKEASARKQAEEKSAREKEEAANKAELDRLDKADAQEKKDMAANNREAAEIAEEQERLRKGGREAKKMRGRTKNYQNARKKAAAVPNMTHPDGSKVPEGTIYAVVDAAKGGDIVTSYDGEGYDQALQNSDTGTQATELIGRHSDNPNAALMLGSDSTSQGIPVVDPDTGDVVIHNTGVMIRRAMAEKGTDKEYNEKLAAEAKRLKVPFPDDARIPMLVAYLPEGMSRDAKIEQAKKGNLTTTRSIDAGQRAAADATVFATDDGQKVLSMLPDADSDRLVSEANSAFVKAAYAMLAKEDGDLVDGRPTDKFNDRLENAMMSLLFSGLKEEERTRLVGDLVNDARNLGLADFKSALAVKAAKLNLIALRNKDFDLRPELSKATRDIVKWKRSGMKFAGDYANQLNFDPKDNMPEADKPLFLALGNASQVSAKAVRQVLDAYIDGARAELQGQTLIGDKVTKATLVQRMADASAEIISSRKYSLSDAELKSAAKQDGIDLDKETQEFREIYARYRDTKQWMKAPNGKDSKLTARQWVQVRTPSFKKWAGDWEAASIRKNLGWTDVVDVNAVRSLPSQNITGIKPVADKAALMDLFRSFGEVRNESDGTKVRFPTKSAGKMIFKKNYASAFKSLFESSIHAFTEKETQFDGHKYHPNITSYRHYVNKFSDEEGTHYIRFTVRDDDNGALVHNAEISDIEIYDESDATQFGNQTDGKRRFKDNKLALFFTDVKSTTKIIDENGEPMVMWHQTNNEFTEFNVRHRGKGTSDEQMPFGIFMKYTPNKIWEGGKQMALYANIQRPVQFENREQMADWLRKNVKSYGQLETEYRQAEDEFKHRYDNAQKRQLEEIAKLRQDGAKRSESYNATRTIVQTVLDEWADYESNSPLIAKMKEAINGHLEKIGIDGVIVDQDTGSYGRSVKTCIAMSSNQVKSATDNAGTFSKEKLDIRHSLSDAELKTAAKNDGIDLDKETQEFRDVYARYRGTKQWMKAPNGKDSKLTARQWTQVRTPSFKKWAGDWEMVSNATPDIDVRSYNEGREVLLKLSGKDMESADGLHAILSHASIDKIFSGKAVSKSVSHHAHIVAAANLEKLYSHSRELHTPEEGNRQGIKYMHRLYAPFLFDGQPLLVKISVKEFTSGESNKLYTIEAMDIEKPAGILVPERSESGTDTPAQATEDKVHQLLDDFKESIEKSTKIIDENGEPMVVYHGTKSRFYEFTDVKMGKGGAKNNRDGNLYGNGYYFTNDYYSAQTYGRRVLECFLNIRNPSRTSTMGPENDGLMVNSGFHKTYLATSPTQIKSATDNVGTFSNENPDIRYSLTEAQRKGAEDLDIDLDKETQEFRDVFARYHGTRQWMKAPNGSRTNLSARQWVQVRTPAFKQWFGDWENETQNNSKVVDENGEPKIVYHGTVNGAFTVFDKDRIGERWNADEIGFFFTSDEAIGIDYTIPYGSKEGKPHLFNVYLNIKKPLMINSKWFRENYNRSISRYDAIEIWDDNQADILDAFNQGEYDGIVINPTGMGMPQPKMYIAMESNQIKSATDNVGTFSEENPDIRYSLIGPQGASRLGRTSAVAEQMEKKGKTADQIWAATGWERGADGKWRTEIKPLKVFPYVEKDPSQRFSDFLASRKAEDISLKNLVSSKELFKAYPELNDITVERSYEAGTRGTASLNDGKIYVNERLSTGAMEDVLTHEIQHLIQEIEGFARGGTPGATAWLGTERLFAIREFNKLLDNTLVPDTIEEYAKNAWGSRTVTPEIEKAYKQYVKDLRNPSDSLLKALQKAAGDNVYYKLAGEVEARNAVSRSPAYGRRFLRPELTESVKREEQYVRYSLISKKEDDAYMAAAGKGDMAAAQKMVDKAAAAAGYTIKAYHGTPNGTFTVFRGWQYFTENKSYADIYQNQGASSNGYKTTAEKPRTYDVYLKTDKPFDTRNEAERKIFEDEFLGKWGNGTPLSERGLPDWTDGDDLVEFFEENGYDYDAIYLDEGATGGYGDEVKDRGVAIVIKNPEQIKSADPITRDDNGTIIPLSRRFDENEPDIRYSLISKEEDAAYMNAVSRGDMETAQKMVDDAAERNGYSADDSWRMQHRAPNRESGDPNLENIKDSDLVPDDYWDHPEWYQSSDMEREAFWTVRKHIARAEEKKAKGDNSPTFMKVYRAVSKTSNKREERVRNGDWVTPLKAYAIQEGRMNPEGYRIIQTSARLQDLYWDGNSIAEMGYDDGQNYAYKDTANNRKLLDAVTYDDDGNVIPLSKRFNKRDIRTRYSLRRNQSNPIVSDGKVRADYQDLLDNGRYTPEHVAEWEAGAVQWIRKVGGVENAVGLIVDGLEPSGKIGTMARRLVMESDTFKALPQETQLDVDMRNIMQGTEWGREGFARRVASMTLDSAAKVRRVIDAFRGKLTPKERDKMREDVLRDTGIDLDKLPDDIHRDREKLDSLITATLASKATTKDKLYEYWVNAILSAPMTHVANTVGNLANFAYELGVKRLAEAAVNHFAKRPDAARFSDFRAMWASVDWKNAWRSAVQAFNIEVLDASGKYVEGAAPAIEGKKGRIIRIPGRFLRAADEFAKAIIVPIETAAMADRL